MTNNNILPIIDKQKLNEVNSFLDEYGLKHIDEKQAICALNEYRKMLRTIEST